MCFLLKFCLIHFRQESKIVYFHQDPWCLSWRESHQSKMGPKRRICSALIIFTKSKNKTRHKEICICQGLDRGPGTVWLWQWWVELVLHSVAEYWRFIVKQCVHNLQVEKEYEIFSFFSINKVNYLYFSPILCGGFVVYIHEHKVHKQSKIF